MWFLPQTVKNFNNCKHNVYCSFCMELDLLMQFIALHFTWDTPWIPTWMKYRVSQVSEYIYVYILWSKIVSNNCHIWMVTFIVQCKPKSTLKSIKIYKCKLWHLLWEILAKTKIYEIVQLCMIHRSIHDLV